MIYRGKLEHCPSVEESFHTKDAISLFNTDEVPFVSLSLNLETH